MSSVTLNLFDVAEVGDIASRQIDIAEADGPSPTTTSGTPRARRDAATRALSLSRRKATRVERIASRGRWGVGNRRPVRDHMNAVLW